MAGDPFYSNVSLLLHCDGANGSTTFTDTSPTPKTVTAVGNAQVSTAQSKYGGASATFGSSSYLNLPSNSVFDYGTGALTIEAWIYPTTATGSIYSQRNGGGITFRVLNQKLSFFYGEGTASVTGPTTIALNQWHHVALTRSGNSFQMWLNGVAEGSASAVSASMPAGITPRIAAALYATLEAFSGFMDDVRITKGVARYSSTFTPPLSLATTVPVLPFPSPANAGQLVTDGSSLYVCVASGTPGTWKQTPLT